MSTVPTVLVVDDERSHRIMLRAHLEDSAYRVLEAQDGKSALDVLEANDVDIVLMDLVMPGMDGATALPRIKELYPDLPVIIMTAYGSIESAVTALKAGAEDYLPKPLDVEEVIIKVKRRLEAAGLIRRVRDQAERLGERFDFSALIGESPAILRLKEALTLIAPVDSLVLITGESGTGKEVVAQIIHQNSRRASGPLVKVNCAALPENLLESELFGHEKGAFTGAISRREGRIQSAQGGTLFLDEIGEMSLPTQAKLLRFLQENEFSPLGSDKVLHSNARVLVATNRNLTTAVEEKSFREDLFYRLNVLNVEMPPLRERGDDVLLLAERFLALFNQRNSRSLRGLTSSVRQKFLTYPWPGNVRELVNLMERIAILATGPLVEMKDLPINLQNDLKETDYDRNLLKAGLTLQEMERTLILKTLELTQGNRTQAAQLLGITRKTLQSKIKEYTREN